MILRFLLNDNPEMSLKAKEIIENEVVSVTTEVIAEVVYVLSSYYKFERIEVAKAVTGFLNMQSVRSDSYSVLVVALLKYSEVSLDFVDCLLYAYNRVKGYDICTFDNKLLKHIINPGDFLLFTGIFQIWNKSGDFVRLTYKITSQSFEIFFKALFLTSRGDSKKIPF